MHVPSGLPYDCHRVRCSVPQGSVLGPVEIVAYTRHEVNHHYTLTINKSRGISPHASDSFMTFCTLIYIYILPPHRTRLGVHTLDESGCLLLRPI